MDMHRGAHLCFAGLMMGSWLVAFALRCKSGSPPYQHLAAFTSIAALVLLLIWFGGIVFRKNMSWAEWLAFLSFLLHTFSFPEREDVELQTDPPAGAAAASPPVGVDEMLWDDMHKNDMVWPTVKEVQEYRKKVYKIVSEVIATHPDLEDNNGTTPVKITWDHPLWSIFMGVEHEAIHLETSSVLFRETPSHLMQVPASWPGLHPSSLQSARSLRPEVGQELHCLLL
eukprot:s762_g11.t1